MCFAGSGSHTYIQIRFVVMSMVESIKIPSIPKRVARIPQSAGPMRNADPKAAPMSPIFFARVSAVDISEM